MAFVKWNDVKKYQVYQKAHCSTLIEMGKQGKSVAEFCASLNISEKTFYNWAKKYKEFGEAKEIYKAHAKAWWLKSGQAYLTTYQGDKGEGEKFDSSLYKFQVSGRFGFGKNQERDQALDGFASASSVERYEKVMQCVAEGEMTATEAKNYTAMIRDKIPIEVHEDMLKVVHGLIERVDELATRVVVPKVAEEPEFEVIDDSLSTK